MPYLEGKEPREWGATSRVPLQPQSSPTLLPSQSAGSDGATGCSGALVPRGGGLLPAMPGSPYGPSRDRGQSAAGLQHADTHQASSRGTRAGDSSSSPWVQVEEGGGEAQHSLDEVFQEEPGVAQDLQEKQPQRYTDLTQRVHGTISVSRATPCPGHTSPREGSIVGRCLGVLQAPLTPEAWRLPLQPLTAGALEQGPSMRDGHREPASPGAGRELQGRVQA